MSRQALCYPSEVLESLADLYDGFTGKKSRASKYLRDPKSAFADFVYMELGVEMDKIKYIAQAGGLSKGDVRGLGIKLDKHFKSFIKGDMSGSVNWYVPASFAKKDPTIVRTLDNYQKAGFRLQSRMIQDDADMTRILSAVRNEAEITGIKAGVMPDFLKRLAGKTPQQKHNALTNLKRKTIFEAHAGKEGAAEKLEELKRQEDELIKDTELNVFNNLMDIVQNGLAVAVRSENKRRADEATRNKKEYKPLINLSLAYDNFKPGGTSAADINGNKISLDLPRFIERIRDKDGKKLNVNMQDALSAYINMMDRGHTNLANGVKAKIEMLKLKAADQFSPEELKEYEDKLMEQLIPNIEAGFFPHFVEDLRADFWAGMMPLFDSLDQSANRYDRKSNDQLTVRQALDNIKTYVSDHTKKRADQREYEYSPNFMLSVQEYLHDVNRFNFISHVDKYQAQAIRSIEKMYKGTEAGLEGYARRVADFVIDMHESATGRAHLDNPQMRSFLQTVLGFEFVSKMGLNLRGAAKNWTQRLLDNVHWSRHAIKESNEWWSDGGSGSSDISVGYGESADPRKVLLDLGIGFQKGVSPELQESQAMGGGETKVARLNEETGKIEFVPVSKMQDVAGWVGQIGSKAAVMHRWVENNNRTRTFKIAYHQMWKWLNVPEFYQQHEGKSSNVVKNIIHKSAENYALKMVIGHHFDYNDFSKSSILTSSGGRLLGQFQHFSFSFIEKSWDIVRRAKNDVLAGDLRGHNAWAAYRYSMIYFLAPVLAAMYTGLDITGLVDNDVRSRVEDMAAWMLGDEEEKRKAFYGKGPVMGNIGAPVLSDILTVGQLFEFWNLNDDSMLGLLSGYEDTAHRTSDRATYEKVRLLNTALARGLFRTLPALSRGQIGWAAQSEVGMYPTKEAREMQKLYGFRSSTKTEKKAEKKRRLAEMKKRKKLMASLYNVQGLPTSSKYNTNQKSALLKSMDLIKKQQFTV